MPRQTAKNQGCPFCGEPESTEFVAMYPRVRTEGARVFITEPHQLSVCAGCYFAQRARRYPGEPPPDPMRNGPAVRERARAILGRHPEIEGAAEALALLEPLAAADRAALNGG